MPAHLIYGDSYLVTQALKELEDQVGPREILEANSHRVAGAQRDPAQLKALCSAVPFLAEHRLVVVEGLLSLFNSPEGRRRQPSHGGQTAAGGSGQGNMAAWENLPRYIEGEMPPTTLLVFLEGSVSKGNPLLKELQPVIQVRELPAPSGEALARWIRNGASEKGSQITPGAIRLISQLVGSNLWTMDNELEKLALYAGDRPIEEGDVRQLVSQAKEASIFVAVDALLDGRSSAALGLIHRLRNDGAEFTYIVAMIARQLRLTTLAKDLMDRGHKQADVGKRLGLNSDFALKRTADQARKHSWSSLRWLYARLTEADLAVKRGRLDQDVALELFVGETSAPPAEFRVS